MKPQHFFIVTREGALGLGSFPFHDWHKHERESILKAVGVKVEYGEVLKEAEFRGTFKTVGDLEHSEMIRMYVDENILIYIDRRRTGQFEKSDYVKWERKFLDLPNAVTSDWIQENQEEVVACFSFFDINELIDISPNIRSVYIHSTSEPHNEEQIIDEQRLNNWIDFFGLAKYHFHCSGHASGTEIQRIIQTINPRELIPIHTEQPEVFRKMHTNVSRPKLEEF